MPYASGELLKSVITSRTNGSNRALTRVHVEQDEQERVCIMWKDGRTSLLFCRASEYSLTSRKPSRAAQIPLVLPQPF